MKWDLLFSISVQRLCSYLFNFKLWSSSRQPGTIFTDNKLQELARKVTSRLEESNSSRIRMHTSTNQHGPKYRGPNISQT